MRLYPCAVGAYAPSASLLGAGAVPSAAGPGDPNTPKFSMFNLKAYRKYFNVDTQVSPGRFHVEGRP
jgi:hypothetical protein